MEIKLNNLTYRLCLGFPKYFDQFRFEIYSLLTEQGIFSFESEILKTAPFDNMKDGLRVYPEKFHSIGQRFNAETQAWEPAYFNFNIDYEVTPKNHNYSTILSFSLLVNPLKTIDSFLNFHLSTYFYGNLTDFKNQLDKGLKKVGFSILNENSILNAVCKWMLEEELKQIENIVGVEKFEEFWKTEQFLNRKLT